MKTKNTSPQTDSEPTWELSYATGYFHLGMYDKAQEEIEAIPVEGQHDAEVMCLKGRLLLAEKKWKEAISFCNDARKCHPRVSDFYIQEALAFDKLNRHEDARTTWLSAPREIRATAFYHYNLARCECKLGHFALARQHVKAAISLSPSMREIMLKDKGLRIFISAPENN